MLDVYVMSLLGQNLDSRRGETHSKLERTSLFWNANVHGASLQYDETLTVFSLSLWGDFPETVRV